VYPGLAATSFAFAHVAALHASDSLTAFSRERRLRTRVRHRTAAAVQCFGTFASREEAARAYDLGCLAAGVDAVLNFRLTDYVDPGSGAWRPDLPWPVPATALAAGAARSRAAAGH
jgi:hypothetical protein